MTRAKIDAEKLRGFLDCMHDEADARDERSVAIRDIVKTAKEVGYDTKAIRKVFVRERMDEAERSKQDDLLESYEHALGGKGRALVAIAEGASVKEAAKANGVHRATIARARRVAKQPSNATPHDPETGEVSSGDSSAVERLVDIQKVPGSNPDPRSNIPLPSSAPVAASEKEVLGANSMALAIGLSEVQTPPAEGEEITLKCTPACVSSRPATVEEITPPVEMGAERALASEPPPEIDLTIPPFLRRERISA